MEVPRQGHESHNASLLAIVAEEGETLDPNYAECSSPSERSASCCRSVALIVSSLPKLSNNMEKERKRNSYHFSEVFMHGIIKLEKVVDMHKATIG